MREFGPFYPKSFCRDFIELKGNSLQLVMYMAMVLGFKPLMDDWVEERQLKEFTKLCRNYGLHLKVDCSFKSVKKEVIEDKIVGGQTLTSTVCYGLPKGVSAEARAHVFISKDKNLLKKGMWYSLIIRNRVVWSPRHDILNYGFALGYPGCCIKFFRKYNDWCTYSYLYQAYKNSKRYSYLCNPLLKDDYYSYIYHMPCSFDCKETIKQAGKLRQGIIKMAPEFVKAMDIRIKSPFLVFYEKKIYAFKGRLVNNKELIYSKVHFVNAEEERNSYMQKLLKGNRLKLDGGRIDIYNNNDKVEIIDASVGGFAPEFPFLVKFD